MLVLLIQIVLPVALLAWLQRFPAAALRLYLLQVVAVAAVLAGLASAGMWVFPPWWFPHMYVMAFLLIVALRVARRNQVARWNWLASLIFAAVLGLGAYGGYLTYGAFAGRKPPSGVDVVDIAAPFPTGTYLVAHGGSNLSVNAHMKTLDESVERFKQWSGASFGLDIIRIDHLGRRTTGYRPTDPALYFTFGTPLLAPCTGSVVAARDGMPDMPVPVTDTSSLPGNYVIMDCQGFAVVMAHLRKRSILVRVGQVVTIGDKLAELGNSGNSTEPHLHIHAQRDVPRDLPLGGEPLALTINGRFLVRNDRISVP